MAAVCFRQLAKALQLRSSKGTLQILAAARAFALHVTRCALSRQAFTKTPRLRRFVSMLTGTRAIESHRMAKLSHWA